MLTIVSLHVYKRNLLCRFFNCKSSKINCSILIHTYLQVDAGGKIRRFYGMKTEWGFDQLIPIDIFNNESIGYLVDDNCAFGAEVFVTKYAGKGQCLSMMKESKENTYAWTIDNFSTRNESSITDEFEAGGRKW